jgi:hypothetical protein
MEQQAHKDLRVYKVIQVLQEPTEHKVHQAQQALFIRLEVLLLALPQMS